MPRKPKKPMSYRNSDGRKVWRVERPDLLKEELVSYYKEFPKAVKPVEGRIKSRNSYTKHNVSQTYPVKKNGDLIELHTVIQGGYVYTTKEFMQRFIYVLRYVRKLHSMEDGGAAG